MAAELHDLLSQNFSEVEPISNQDDEELLVFGYSCKLFRDDERAQFIEQGKHLIPWMGDESHQIDRYDVRGYLSDLRLHESASNKQSQYPDWELLSPEEKRIEQLCEEERYLALYTDLTEEQIYHEEELKRLKAALAEDGAYHEIGFSYDDTEDNSQEESQSQKATQDDEREFEDEPFSIPEGLTVPDNLLLPETMKHHLIIERTAGFVSQHGNQMEIVIKSKQASNPQFSFLAFDSALNPYYKNLIMAIKTGKYIPKPPEPENASKEQSEDEEGSDDDDHYLHPSLLGKKEATPVNIPDLRVFRNLNHNDTYSKLVKNLMENMANSRESSPSAGPATAENSLAAPPLFTSMETYWQHFGGPPGDSPHLVMAYNNQPPPPGDEALYQMFTENVGGEVVYHMLPPPPPPDIQPIIDKMAEYVARSGEDFEMVVKSKRDKRFEFLSAHHEYHQYYLYKKKCHLDVRKQHLDRIHNSSSDEPLGSGSKASGTAGNSNNSSSGSHSRTGPIAPVCFSIRSKEGAEVSKDKKVFSLVGEMDSEEEYNQEGAEGEGASATEARNALLDRLVAAAAVAATASTVPVLPPPPPTQEEIQAKKILEAKAAEARLAGERLRDKLANAAREKMSQQTKERQLQLERKRKAALFLNMLKSSGNLTLSSQSKTPRDHQQSPKRASPVFGPQMPDDHNRNEDSAASGRSSPADDRASIVEYEDVSNRHSSPEVTQLFSPQHGRSRLSFHSRSHQQRGSPERSRHKTSKHRNHTSDSKRSSGKPHKRHKTPPSSYAFARRSRSRSVSPKRHRQSRSKDRSHRR